MLTRSALSRFRHPYLLLTLTMLFWSGNMVLGRAIRDQVPPLTLAFWRWTIAFSLALPLALPHLRAQWPLLRRGWKPLFVLGLIGVGGYNTFAYLALNYTPATNAVLINSVIPMATITLSWLFLGQRLRPVAWLGVALSFLGVAAIVCRGQVEMLAALSLNVGDLWMLAAVLTWAVYTIGLQWRPAGVDPLLMLAALTIIGLLPLAPAYAWEVVHGREIVVSFASLAGIAYTGVFPGFLGYVFYNRAVGEVGANQASLFLHLLPVFGTALSVVFLGERLQVYHYVGITLIFFGIYLTTRSREPPTA